MRICIVGGGIAGTLLAWRLAGSADVERIDLHVGGHTTEDATDASGGVVRGFEPHVPHRRLAIESLTELLGSAVLREWSQFRSVPSLYLRRNGPGLSAELREIWTAFPGSARFVGAEELFELGWADLPRGTVGILEHAAGYFSPKALRRALLADLTMRRGVSVSWAAVDRVIAQAEGTVACTVSGHRRDYDVAVIAAGAWTPRLLAASGLSSIAYRTKSVQYTIYAVGGCRPLPFFDETSGLYGRPTPSGGMLLGLASDEWDVTPGRGPVSPDLQAGAASIAGLRLPLMELGPVQSSVSATDCYTDPPMLDLRPAGDEAGSVWTFTGGSGGSAKTALAASLRASQRLIDSTQPRSILDHPSLGLKVSQA